MGDARDKDYEAGFNADFEESGEEAVSRHLSSGNFSAGKAEMARIWLDRKRQAERRRANRRAFITLVTSIIAAAASVIAATVGIIRH
jgi:FAD/FMN-containing dehydrogenase